MWKSVRANLKNAHNDDNNNEKQYDVQWQTVTELIIVAIILQYIHVSNPQVHIKSMQHCMSNLERTGEMKNINKTWWGKKACLLRILYPVKMCFKNKGKTNDFRHIKGERIHQQMTYSVSSINESPSLEHGTRKKLASTQRNGEYQKY